MAFWSNDWNDTKLREPLRQNRWYIEFGNSDLEIYRYALKECKKPEYEISVTEHRLLTHVLRYPGILKWKPLEIKFVSVRNEPNKKTKSLNESLLGRIYELGYIDPNTGVQQQISKSKQNLALIIVQVDANGNDIERWKLSNCFISSTSYGSLSYESDGFVDVAMTIQYDWAELETLEPKVSENDSINGATDRKPPYILNTSFGSTENSIPKFNRIPKEPVNPLSNRELTIQQVHNILAQRELAAEIERERELQRREREAAAQEESIRKSVGEPFSPSQAELQSPEARELLGMSTQQEQAANIRAEQAAEALRQQEMGEAIDENARSQQTAVLNEQAAEAQRQQEMGEAIAENDSSQRAAVLNEQAAEAQRQQEMGEVIDLQNRRETNTEVEQALTQQQVEANLASITGQASPTTKKEVTEYGTQILNLDNKSNQSDFVGPPAPPPSSTNNVKPEPPKERMVRFTYNGNTEIIPESEANRRTKIFNDESDKMAEEMMGKDFFNDKKS